MDLNELFFQHQIAVIRISSAGEPSERRRFAAQADGFAVKIGALQQRRGATAAPLAMASAL